jgi:hypothetical protein
MKGKLPPRPRRTARKPRVEPVVTLTRDLPVAGRECVDLGPMSPAARQRLHRQRQRNGKLALTVEVDTAEVIELLVEAQLLDPRAAFHGRAEIAAGIGRFLSLCCHA